MRNKRATTGRPAVKQGNKNSTALANNAALRVRKGFLVTFLKMKVTLNPCLVEGRKSLQPFLWGCKGK